jgi:hypothetical protein
MKIGKNSYFFFFKGKAGKRGGEANLSNKEKKTFPFQSNGCLVIQR